MSAVEDVWLYPRPPAIEAVTKPIRIQFAGRVIAQANAAWRILETTHPPVYYLPREAFTDCELLPASGGSLCEWKGRASYWTIRAGGKSAKRVAWGYADPLSPYEPITDHLAVYAGPMDACVVGGEKVTPQPGGFYGGWITSDLKGPFKGSPGSMGW